MHGRRDKKAPAKQLRTFSEISTLALVEEEAQPDPLSAANMVRCIYIYMNIIDIYMLELLPTVKRSQRPVHSALPLFPVQGS